MPTVTFTLLSGKGKGPTYTFNYSRVRRAPMGRSGDIRAGLAKVAGWKLSPEGRHYMESRTRMTVLPPLKQTLGDIGKFCVNELKRLRLAQH